MKSRQRMTRPRVPFSLKLTHVRIIVCQPGTRDGPHNRIEKTRASAYGITI